MKYCLRHGGLIYAVKDLLPTHQLSQCQRVNKRTCARSALADSLKRSFPGISSSAERIASISARRVLSLLSSASYPTHQVIRTNF